jgi:hypothetical protein
MSNVYQLVKNDLNLQSDAQGENEQFSWMFILLDKLGELDAAHPIADVIVGNPYRELLETRLSAYHNTFAYKNRIAPLLKARAERYSNA